jgi:hypothetical protein
MVLDVRIHEGEFERHYETLSHSESITWDMSVSDEYDINFSVIVRSHSSSTKSSWIYLEPTRLCHSAGAISTTDLEDDGIPLPVLVEFLFDNSYSWFSPKDVRLSINRICNTPTEPTQDRSSSTTASPDREEMERRRSAEVREHLDLVWMKHVIVEALDRCPESYFEVRKKLDEIRGLLKFIDD